MAWTEQQEAAITTRDCGLIVSAAAGSGKTSVLVERLLRILMEEDPEKRVPADRMIVVTFTNDAAAEMKTRLYQALDLQIEQHPENKWLYQQQILLQSAHISTISSFCFDFIRDNLSDNGITAGFRILNDTESKLMESKAADAVLNQWYTEHPEEMKFLWDCFCEKSDAPIERILLELHHFFGSVPFREQWQKKVLSELEKPLSETVYHKKFQDSFEQLLENSLDDAREAVDIASGLYDTVKDNTVLPWVQEDLRCLEKLKMQLDAGERDTSLLGTALLEKRKSRKDGNKRYPRAKKNIVSTTDYDTVKALRDRYSVVEDQLCEMIQSIFPYEELDIAQHRQLAPIFFSLEKDLFDAIWEMKVQQNVLGFDDAERMALELLSQVNEDGKLQPSALAKEMADFYQLIMIDEYQDSNNKQDDIFKLISRNCIDSKTGDLRYGENVFLVGDVKQAIYRFRLANPQNFVSAIHSSANSSSVCKHISLNRNFRSVPAILNFVNYTCGNLMSLDCGDVQYDEGEALQAGTAISAILPEEEQAVHVAVLHENADGDVQQQYVIRQIQKMIQNKTVVAQKDGTLRPCEYRDFCILLRDHTLCHEFAHALERAGIPVRGTEEKGYLQAREVSLLLDMLRVLDNPLLDTSLAAIMLSPMFWFTAEELVQLRMLSKKSSLYADVCMAIDVMPAEKESSAAYRKELPELLLQKCQELYQILQQLRQDAALMTLENLIHRIYDRTDFLSVMQLTQDGERKRANLNMLLQYARQYEENQTSSAGGISGFLRYIDWLVESGNDFQQVAPSAGIENAVVIKTMHGSKGLEYPFVFLGNLNRNFSGNEKRKTALFLDSGMIGFRIKNPEEYTEAKTLPYLVLEQEIEKKSKSEELRLLYVAMTRAKQQLFLPLVKEKLYQAKKYKLDEYAKDILPDGTLPASLVLSAKTMADWIWMCLVLSNDATLQKIIKLPEKNWDTPAWMEHLQIQYEDDLPEVIAEETETQKHLPDADPAVTSEILHMIEFQYQSSDAERASLLSVSAIQESQNHSAPIWKRPQFLQKTRKLTGAERGTAIHTFFQYADFKRAELDVPAEIGRLQTHGFLTKEQAAVVQPETIQYFFKDPIYRSIRSAKRILREKKFLVCCKDLKLSPKMEAVLQQYQGSDSMIKGIIDLAFSDGKSYTLLEYKTDVISSEEQLIERYQEQLMLYRAALECISGMQVKQCYFYSTHLQRSIEVKGLEEEN